MTHDDLKELGTQEEPNYELATGEDDGFAKLLEIRNWLSGSLAKQGVEVEGAGPGADFEFTTGERHCSMSIWEVEEDYPIPKKVRGLVQVPSEIMKLAQRLTYAVTKHGADIEWGGRDGFVFTLGGRRYWVEITYALNAVEAAELSQANDCCSPEPRIGREELFRRLALKDGSPSAEPFKRRF